MPTQDIVEQQSPKLREFYDRFKEPMKLPDFELFQRTLQDPTKRKEFYDSFQKPAKLPDYETFQNTLGLNKPSNEPVQEVSDTEEEKPKAYSQESWNEIGKSKSGAKTKTPEPTTEKGKNGQDLTALYDVMAKQETIKDSGMYGETSKLPKSAAQMEQKVKGEEYARSVITDADFQKSTVSKEEKDMVDLKSYFDLQKERYSTIASDLETWTNSAVQGAEVNAADKTQKDPKYIAIVTDIQNKTQEYQQQLTQQFKEQIGERQITTNEANEFNSQINQKVQAFQDDLFEKNPELKNIHQSYIDKEVTRLDQESLQMQKEMMRPNTKILPQSVIDLGNKLVSSDAFQSLGYEEKKYTLANNWKRISRSLSSKGFNQGRILMMRDEFYFAMMPKVLYDEEQHMTPFALRSWAEENMDSVDKQLKEVQAKLKENQSQTDLIGSYRPANAEFDPNMGLPPVDKADDNLRKDFQNLLLAKQNLEAIRNMPEENMGTFGQGFLDSGIRNKVPFISSMMDIMDLNRLLNTANKVKNKEQLTDADQALLNSYSAKENMEQLSKPSMWYNAGKATAASVPYMAEFVATSGIFDGTYLAAKAGLTKALGKAAEKTLYQRAFIKPLAGILAVEAQTAANPQAYIKNTMERMRPSMQVAFSEEANDLVAKLDWNAKNELTGYNTGRGEDKWTAFVKGYLLTSGEMATERAGEVLTGTFKWALAKPGVQKFMSPDLMKRMTLGYYMEKYGYSISEARKRIMSHGLSWNGFPAEMVEEVLNIPFSNIVTGDQSVFTGIVKEDGTGIDWNNLGTIAISIGATTGVMTVAQFAMARKAKPVTVHYTDASGTTAPVIINGEAFNKLVESTRNLNAEELTKWKDETLPKMNLKGEEKQWVNDYVDVIIKKKQAEASPNSDPTMNTDSDQMLAEVEEIIQEEAEIIATENPKLVSTDTVQQLRPNEELQKELDEMKAKRQKWIEQRKDKYDPESFDALERQIADWEKSVVNNNSKNQTNEKANGTTNKKTSNEKTDAEKAGQEEVLETSTEEEKSDSVKKIEDINDQISEVEGKILNKKKELLDKKITFGDDKDLSDLESKLKKLRDDKSAVVDQKKSNVSEKVKSPSVDTATTKDDIERRRSLTRQTKEGLSQGFRGNDGNFYADYIAPNGNRTQYNDPSKKVVLNKIDAKYDEELSALETLGTMSEKPTTTDAVTPEVEGNNESKVISGKEVWRLAEKAGSENHDFMEDQGDYREQIEESEYILKEVSIDELRKNDQDLDAYLEDIDFNAPKRKIETPIIIGSADRGQFHAMHNAVIDGFHRVEQAMINGESTVKAYVPIDSKLFQENSPREVQEKSPQAPEEKIKNIVKKSGVPAKNVIVAPSPSKQQAVKDEIDDLLGDFDAAIKNSQGNLTVGGLDPEVIRIGAKLISKYIELGKYKLTDILKDAAGRYVKAGKEFTNDLFKGFQTVYLAYQADVDEATLDQMESTKEVRTIQFNDILPTNQEDGKLPITGSTDASGVPDGTPTSASNQPSQNQKTQDLSGGKSKSSGPTGKPADGPRPNRGGGTRGNSGNTTSSSGSGNGIGSKSDKPSTETGNNRQSGKLNKRNAVITDSTVLVESGTTAKARANIDAIKLLKELEAEERNDLTDEEKNKLLRFTGWGGLSEILNDAKYAAGPISEAGWHKKNAKLHEEIKDLLTQEEFKDAQNSTINAHYTDRKVISEMWNFAAQLGFNGGEVLEPSMGIGHFFGLMPSNLSSNSQLRGYELDSITGRLAQKLYPDAKIRVEGFENSKEKPSSIDLAITNVPFGAKAPFDAANQDLSKFNLHNYFIAKNIRLLKPGGLAIIITSRSTMDIAGSAPFRRWVTSDGNADFIGGVRLPNNAFSENAGTQVTTDILVFRKRTAEGNNQYAQDFSNTVTIDQRKGQDGKLIDVDVNQFYANNQDMVLGEHVLAHEVNAGGLYGGDDITVTPIKGKNIVDQLKEAFAKFPQNIAGSNGDVTNVLAESTELPEGSYSEKNGIIYEVVAGELVRPWWSGKKVGSGKKQTTTDVVAKDYLIIKDTIKKLIGLELSDASETEIESERRKLNLAYDFFVKQYGNFNNVYSTSLKVKNAEGISERFLEDDVEYNMVSGLEFYKKVYNPKTLKFEREFTKSQIFRARISFPISEPTQAKNLNDALNISIVYKGAVDINYISKLLNFKPVSEIEKELEEKTLAYKDPATGLYELPGTYLSGNIKQKIDLAEASAKTDSSFSKNIEALREVLPAPKPLPLINFNIGVNWIPAEIYEKALADVYGLKGKIIFNEIIGKWSFDKFSIIDSVKSANYSTEDMSAADIVSAVMNMGNIVVKRTVKDPDGSSRTYVDQKATSDANAKSDDVKDSFIEYIRTHDTFGTQVENLYNEKFNVFVEPKWNEGQSDEKQFPGMSSAIELRPHQYRAAIKGTRTSLLLAHQVGTGKTFTMICAAMEMRRLGLARKPAIVVQNATIGDFVQDFKKVYPNAKILSPSTKERSKDKRQKLFASIAYNDWDAIIIPQSFLDFIPDDPMRESKYLTEQLDMMKEALSEMDSGDPSRFRLQKEIEKSEKHINELKTGSSIEKKKRDGKDIFVATLSDGMEAAFKTQEEAENALVKDRSSKIKTVKEQAKSEMRTEALFNRQRNRRTDKILTFEGMGIDALFLDEAHRYKKLGFSTAMGNVKGVSTERSKTAFGAYMKMRWIQENNAGRNVILATGTPITNTVAEIWTMFRYVADPMVRDFGIQNFDSFVANFANVTEGAEFTAAGTFKPVKRLASYINVSELIKASRQYVDVVLSSEVFKEGTDSALPVLKNKLPTDIFIDQSEELEAEMMRFRAELEAFNQMSGKQKKENRHIPLTVFTKAKKAAIDLRLLDPDYPDSPGSKTNASVKEILRIYAESTPYRGTQLVFSDLYQDSSGKFNLYKDIKRKLVAVGIPENEIAIVHDYGTDEKRAKLFESVREGKVRVLIGSTEKMGVGVNVQMRLVALHHLDAPPMPMQYEQRNGRLIRQGNLHAVPESKGGFEKPVEMLRYGVKKTLDVTAYQRLEIKRIFIEQFLKGEVEDGAEETDDESIVEGGFDTMMAYLSGSDTAVIYFQKQADLKKAQSKQRNHENKLKDLAKQRSQLRDNQRTFPNEIKELEAFIKEHEGDLNEEGKPSSVTLYGPNGKQDISDKYFSNFNDFADDYKKKLLAAALRSGTVENSSFGIDVGNLSLKAQVSAYPKAESEDSGEFGTKRGDQFHVAYYDNKRDGKLVNVTNYISSNSLFPIVQRYLDLESDKNRINDLEQRLKNIPETLEKIEKEIQKPFDMFDKIAELTIQVKQLKDKMEEEFGDKPSEPETGTGEEQGDDGAAFRKEGDKLSLPGKGKKGIDDLIKKIDALKVGKPGQLFSFDPITALGVSVWNTALDVFKTSLIAGKMLYDAINDAVISLRPHLPSAAVSEDEVRDYLETAIKNPDTLLSVADQRQLKSTVKAGLGGKSNAIHNTLYNSPIFAGPTIKGGVIGSTVRFQQKTFGAASQGAGDLISKAALKGLKSNIPGLSQLTRALSHIFQNLERDSKHVRRAEQFYGTTESRAMLDAASLSNHLKDVLKVQGVDALRRIDEVLDPEFYSKYSFDDFFKLWDAHFAAASGTSVSSSLSQKEKRDLYEEYVEMEQGIAGFNRTPLSYDDLSDEEKYVHDMIKQVYEYIHDVNFAIGKLGVYTYLKNINKYHARMYNAYEQPASIEAALAEASKYMQLGMYEKRETLDMWKMREKIDDPIHAVSKRLMQTIANKGIADYASWLLVNRPGLVSKTEKTGFVKLESRGYGDLSGKYVLKDIAEDFQGFHFSSGIMQKFYDVIRLFPLLGTDWKSGSKYLPFLSQQFWKKYFTIYNPAVHMGNFMGNIIFAVSMGINPVRFNANFFTNAKAEIKRKGQLYQWMVNEGMMNADVSWEDMTSNVSKMDLLVNKSGMPTWDDLKSKPFNSLARLAERIYHINDNIGKVAAMQSLLQMGLSWDQASEKVKNGMQNRNRIGPLYKVMSKIPIIGPPFGMFTGDLIRIITSGFTRTPLTMGVYIAGLHGLAALASGFGDEDERQRKTRESRPGFTSIPLPELVENDWAKYIPLINFFAGPVPLSIKWGKNGELNLARYLSPLYIYQSPTDDDFYNAIQRLSPLPIEKEMDWTSNPKGIKAVWLAKMAKDPRFSPLIQMWSDSDFRGIPITDRKATVYRPSTITDAEKAANVRKFLSRSYIPYYYLVDDMKNVIETGRDYYDRERTPTQIALRFLVGYNAQVFDDAKYVDIANKAVMAKASQFARNEKLLKDLYNQYLELKKTENPMSIEVYAARQFELLYKQSILFEDVKQELIKARGTLAASEMKAALKKVRMSKEARIKLLNSPVE